MTILTQRKYIAIVTKKKSMRYFFLKSNGHIEKEEKIRQERKNEVIQNIQDSRVIPSIPIMVFTGSHSRFTSNLKPTRHSRFFSQPV